MRILLTILFALSLFTGYAQYQLPMNGTITVSGCSGTMADPGGANNYPTNTNSNLILLPTAGSYIKLDFTSFETEKSWDYVEIYDGPTSNPGSNLIDEYSGTLQPFSVTASNSSGALFIRFRSDNSTTMAGFSANISCVTSPGSSLILNDTYLSFSGVDYEEIGIKSNSSWVVSGLPNWLTINTLSGFGNATLSMTSIQNITTTGRSAVVTVSGSGLIKTFEVYQSALDPLNFSAAKMLEAAASSIKITYEADNYSWSLFSKPDWINVSTFSGTANSAGTITITSLINTGENRKGIIKFKYLDSYTDVQVFQLGTTSGSTILSSTTNQTFTGCSGNYISPGGTNGYSNNLEVKYTFIPSGPSEYLKIEFDYFATENVDHLRVYDGVYTTTSVMNDFYGNYSSEEIFGMQAGKALTLRFTSDVSVTMPGFAFKVSCISLNTVPATGVQTITSCNATILDNGIFGDYQSNSNGTLIIIPTAPGLSIKLSFTEFDTESSSDFLIINSNTFSGFNIPGSQVSESQDGSMAIKFTSDFGLSYGGFTAKAQCYIPTLSVSPSTILTNQAGGIYVVTVTSNSDFWRVKSDGIFASLENATLNTFDIRIAASNTTRFSVVTVSSGSINTLINITQTGITGIADNESITSVSNIYPNPNNGSFTIDNLIIGSKVTISNQLGLIVKSFVSENTAVNIAAFLPGLYIITIDTGNNKITKKVIVH